MRILVLDCETTGTSAEDKLVEVAWCEIGEDLGVISEFSSLVNPGIPIPCNVSGLHGIRTADVQDAPTIDEIPWPDGEILLIAHNAPFDKMFVQSHLQIQNELCTLRLARRLLPDSPDHKLGTLLCYCDLEQQLAHRALGDVRGTLALLDYLVEGSKMGIHELVRWVEKPILLKSMPFGRYKGALLEDLPLSYISWLLTIDLEPDLRHSINKLYPGNF
jgi:DNA polymerase III epsilon subunit-like protein